MAERGRINRVMQNAASQLQMMKSTRNPYKQQAAWEDFLLHWKRSIELLRSYCATNDKAFIRDRMYKQRISDQILNYAWEARNAEEHDIAGSAEPKSGFTTINPLDRNKPLSIEKLSMSQGFLTVNKMENGFVKVEEGRLEMKPVVGPGGKRIIDPPSGVSPLEVCIEAMEFAESFYSEIFTA